MKMTTTVTISDNRDLHRRKLQFIMWQIHDGFYQENDFYILENEIDRFKELSKKSVLLSPFQIEYLSSINNWEDYLPENPLNQNLMDSPEIWEKMVSDYPVDEYLLFSGSNRSVAISSEKLQNAFNEFLDLLTVGDDYEVIISFSDFGTISSMNRSLNKVFIYPRYDCQEIDIFNVFTNLVVRSRAKELKWEEYQTIAKFFEQNLRLSKSLDGAVESTKPLSTIYKSDLRDESNKILTKLGYPIENSLTINNNRVMINNQPVVALSKSQKQILSKLINSRDKIVSAYEIGDIIWGKESDEFSLQAVNKHIERTRERLRKAGLKKEVIHTVRNRGYYLSE